MKEFGIKEVTSDAVDHVTSCDAYRGHLSESWMTCWNQHLTSQNGEWKLREYYQHLKYSPDQTIRCSVCVCACVCSVYVWCVSEETHLSSKDLYRALGGFRWKTMCQSKLLMVIGDEELIAQTEGQMETLKENSTGNCNFAHNPAKPD